jgi:anti-sigma factor RsiW
MKCAELDALMCDYVDGVLEEPARARVEAHLAECAACREMVADGRAALGFMERAADVEVPKALVNRILFEVRAGGEAPVRIRKRSWLGRLFEPVLQPKFAMGMAMTILSFAMLGRFAGIPVRQLKPSDLQPAKVAAALEDKAWRSWERARKYYESLRLVYEIRETRSDWNAVEDGKSTPAKTQPGDDPSNPDRQLDQPIQKRPPVEKKSS